MIMISGNHDAPKSFNQTSPFRLFEGRDVHIAQRYRYERFEVGDHCFHCIPFCLEPQDYQTEFGKITRSGRDVLVMHGMVESLKNQKMRSVGEHELKDSLLKSDFDYIALGHYHGQARLPPTPITAARWSTSTSERPEMKGHAPRRPGDRKSIQ